MKKGRNEMIYRCLQIAILMLLAVFPTFAQRLMVVGCDIESGGATHAAVAKIARVISFGGQEDTSQLKMLAEELTQSLVSGNLDRFIDLTYPKAVKLLGEKKK